MVIIVIDIGYEYLYNVVCLNDIEMWMCGEDSMMKLFNFRKELVKFI